MRRGRLLDAMFNLRGWVQWAEGSVGVTGRWKKGQSNGSQISVKSKSSVRELFGFEGFFCEWSDRSTSGQDIEVF